MLTVYVIMAESEIPFFIGYNLPVCVQFASTYRGTIAVMSPPNDDFIDMLSSIDCCQVHLMPFLLLHSFNGSIHILFKISNRAIHW
jgi:hypothetical protein